MLRDRYKLWIWFMVICIAAQLMFYVVGPWAYNGIKQWSEEYKQNQEQIKQEVPPADELTDEKTQISETLSDIIGILTKTASYIGMLIMVFGIFNFILAFMHEDPDRTHHGVMYMVIGGAMIGLSVLVPSLFEVKPTETDEIANTITTENETNEKPSNMVD